MLTSKQSIVIGVMLFVVFLVTLSVSSEFMKSDNDTGIRACRIIASDLRNDASKEDQLRQYQNLEEMFEESVFQDLQDAGGNLVLAAATAESATDKYAPLDLKQQFDADLKVALTELQYHCSRHGVKTPL